jgi:quercetin dioxygenase-like cupin family protein
MSIQQPDDQERKAGIIKQADAVERRDVAAGTATQMQVLLGPQDGAPHFVMRRFIMGKGGGMPLHTNTVEHEQYVLCGSAEVKIGDRICRVRAGDVVYIPPDIPHFYKVLEAPFEFLCVVPNAPDQIEIVKEERPPSC